MKNTDTRVQVTKQLLKTAVLEILQNKSIDKITVKELCDRAGLNRGTFYLHYDSPAALLRDVEEQFLKETTALFHAFWQEGREQSIMAALFASIQKNSDIVCLLLGPHGDPNFVNSLSDRMRPGILDQWQLEFPHYARSDLDFIYDFVLIGSSRLIFNWLQDSQGIPASQFAKRIERLGHYALIAVHDF